MYFFLIVITLILIVLKAACRYKTINARFEEERFFLNNYKVTGTVVPVIKPCGT